MLPIIFIGLQHVGIDRISSVEKVLTINYYLATIERDLHIIYIKLKAGNTDRKTDRKSIFLHVAEIFMHNVIINGINIGINIFCK